MEGVGQVREGEVGNQFSVLEYFWVEFLLIRFKRKYMFILVLGFSWRFCKQFIFLLILLIFEFQKEFRVLRVLVFFIVIWVVFVGVGFVVRESQGFRGVREMLIVVLDCLRVSSRQFWIFAFYFLVCCFRFFGKDVFRE